MTIGAIFTTYALDRAITFLSVLLVLFSIGKNKVVMIDTQFSHVEVPAITNQLSRNQAIITTITIISTSIVQLLKYSKLKMDSNSLHTFELEKLRKSFL
jgi:hypothetical protein